MSKRAYLDVANHFFHDAVDLCVRFRHCYYGEGVDFQTIRSRRTKAFIDLRIAYESILKGYAAYFLYGGEPTEVIVKAVEKYSHHVDRLFEDVKERLPEGTVEDCGAYANDVAVLPVGLRYRIDAWDFEANREELYYQTIGSERWISGLLALVDTLRQSLDRELNKHSGFVKIDFEELFSDSFSKYKET